MFKNKFIKSLRERPTLTQPSWLPHLSRATQLMLNLMRQSPLTLLILAIMNLSIHWISLNIMQYVSAHPKAWALRLSATGFGLSLTLLGTLLIFYTITYRLFDQSGLTFKSFISQPLSLFVTESLRALTRVLLWAMLLILPGLIVYTRLIYVPLACHIDPKRINDSFDALHQSTRVFQSYSRGLFLFVFLLGLGSFAFELWCQTQMQTPLKGLALLSLNFCIVIWFHCFLFSTYQGVRRS